MSRQRKPLIRARISLDGKLLASGGKPTRRAISDDRIREAAEIQLVIHPLILGDDSAPTISGLPGDFLPHDLTWELVSVTKGSAGTITALYRRK
jgi:riboflavin biosynthesis pyrimidine reductase